MHVDEVPLGQAGAVRHPPEDRAAELVAPAVLPAAPDRRHGLDAAHHALAGGGEALEVAPVLPLLHVSRLVPQLLDDQRLVPGAALRLVDVGSVRRQEGRVLDALEPLRGRHVASAGPHAGAASQTAAGGAQGRESL